MEHDDTVDWIDFDFSSDDVSQMVNSEYLNKSMPLPL